MSHVCSAGERRLLDNLVRLEAAAPKGYVIRYQPSLDVERSFRVKAGYIGGEGEGPTMGAAIAMALEGVDHFPPPLEVA